MLRIYCWLFLGLLWGHGVCNARIVLKEHESLYREELVDGKTFSYRSEIRFDQVGVVRKETWKIDGRGVEAAVYEEEILEAEKNEHRMQRIQEEKFRSTQIDSKVKARTALVKKLLSQAAKSLTHDIHIVEKYNLVPYALFADETISAQEYHQLVNIVVPRALALVQEQQPDFAELQELYERLTVVLDRFKVFMRSTIDNAIEKCDDTRFLKELLLLVS